MEENKKKVEEKKIETPKENTIELTKEQINDHLNQFMSLKFQTLSKEAQEEIGTLNNLAEALNKEKKEMSDKKLSAFDEGKISELNRSLIKIHSTVNQSVLDGTKPSDNGTIHTMMLTTATTLQYMSPSNQEKNKDDLEKIFGIVDLTQASGIAEVSSFLLTRINEYFIPIIEKKGNKTPNKKEDKIIEDDDVKYTV